MIDINHTHDVPSGSAETITAILLAWFREHKRDLPWRHTKDAYRIWISEVMLQQTQVSTVAPYYERFLKRFPTVRDLADAPLDALLAEWQGLGYYARARNLHATARLVCERHGGVLPDTRAELEALPGIGEYTAGAILSVSYGRDEPAIDVNVARVLSRLCDYDGPLNKAAGKKALRQYVAALLPAGQAGIFNQAIMELGATICMARAPQCSECPVAAYCRAKARGVQTLRPIIDQRPPRLAVQEHVVAVLTKDARVLIVRRKPDGLLGGLWELPGGPVAASESHTQALERHLRDGLGLGVQVHAHLAVVKHAYSRFQVTVHAYHCQTDGNPAPTDGWNAYHWLSADELETYGITGVATRVLARVPWAGSGLLI